MALIAFKMITIGNVEVGCHKLVYCIVDGGRGVNFSNNRTINGQFSQVLKMNVMSLITTPGVEC